ncbi:signal transduction protein [Meridianimarinicoccus roseus]|uniref:Signal transduction protein n=1 Tax=Meridianimarinicoccus roseus TaxID=2072018 RepID=A0A2V2LHF8_9RHOB|nr:CBS domain-containing protein [Meridianimarinicoccus roseus]PWR01313.1 signal transduction protein [Meridianimarinicoccus roseus]
MIIRSIEAILSDRPFHTITPDRSVRDACLQMAEADVGALAVMAQGRLVGILSERDVIRKCLASGRRTDETRVAEIMTADPVTIDAAAPLADAMGAMVTGGFRHLPVTRSGAAVGMLSMRDIPTEYRLMFERFREYAGPAAAVGAGAGHVGDGSAIAAQ